MLVLAIKPQLLDEAAPALNRLVNEGTAVLSMLAGKTREWPSPFLAYAAPSSVISMRLFPLSSSISLANLRDVVQIAPEVSGTVSAVSGVDNQYVRRDDILHEIDPERLRLAVALAEAEVEAKRQDMIVHQATARRHSQLGDVVSQETVRQSGRAAAVASAAHQSAVAALDLDKLNLARLTARAPVDGYVTNPTLRPTMS